MPLEVNRTEIARVLGVTPPTVTDWVAKGMPVVQQGARGVPWVFGVAECVRWMVDYQIAQATESSKDVGLEEAERRRTIADARLKEIKLSQELRKVVKVEDVARVWEGRIVASRETFLAIAARLAPELVGEDDHQAIEARIEEEIEGALRELAQWEPDEAPDDEASGDEEHQAGLD